MAVAQYTPTNRLFDGTAARKLTPDCDFVFVGNQWKYTGEAKAIAPEFCPSSAGDHSCSVTVGDAIYCYLRTVNNFSTRTLASSPSAELPVSSDASGSVNELTGDAWATLMVLEQIESLRNLRAGWDGRRARPISRRSLDQVEVFIRQLPTLGTPHVAPMTDGRVQLEWESDRRSLEIEFENSQTIHYLKWQPSDGIEEEDVIDLRTGDWAKANALVAWFFAR